MTSLILLGCTFGLVLALGLQSQFVNNGRYLGAFCNSMMISVAQLGALQIVHAKTVSEYAAYIIGGPLGIVASMYLYRNFFHREPKAP